jgi:uncharacterized protein YbaR (Trm112 family)
MTPLFPLTDRMTIPDNLLDILVCPRCRGELEYRPAESSLVCATCRLRFPVRDGIPIMLIDQATPLDPTDNRGN